MELSEIQAAIIEGNAPAVSTGVKEHLTAGTPPGEILTVGMIPAMIEVGEQFEKGEFYVPGMLIAARAMKAGLDVLKPFLASSGVEPLAMVAIGTVQGDIHDIGCVLQLKNPPHRRKINMRKSTTPTYNLQYLSWYWRPGDENGGRLRRDPQSIFYRRAKYPSHPAASEA